ncbi:lasso RiPP family leader peptide-containing protein [uncultured Jatrophihabitans sp.]|uniref:lasso RiPP family leader peptide-containing protein n=1 Tax=uncultured Jatrophihabitans sp. TaxID=1610747 RepID=UPI0035C95931
MYEAPMVTDLGSVEELTATPAPSPGNKLGSTPDVYSNIVPVVGSFGPVRQ